MAGKIEHTLREVQDYLLLFLITHGAEVEGEFSDVYDTVHTPRVIQRSIHKTGQNLGFIYEGYKGNNKKGQKLYHIKITKKGLRFIQQKRNLDETA